MDDDIRMLIQARLNEHESSKVWSREDSSIVPTLVQRADGLFIYARTVVDFITGDLSPLQDRYTTVLSVDEDKFRLPPLNQLYRTVLESVFPTHEQWPQRKKNLRSVLGYLVAIREWAGISPKTLERITGMRTGDSVPILNKLRSVVFFEQDNSMSAFRIVHATFREFLTDSTPYGLGPTSSLTRARHTRTLWIAAPRRYEPSVSLSCGKGRFSESGYETSWFGVI